MPVKWSEWGDWSHEKVDFWNEAEAHGVNIGRAQAFRELALAEDATELAKIMNRLRLAEDLIDWTLHNAETRGPNHRFDDHLTIQMRESVAQREEPK